MSPSPFDEKDDTLERTALPNKQVMYESGAADLSYSGALMEVIDNIIDNARRTPRPKSPKVTIIYEEYYENREKVETLTVHDNTGGVKNEDRMDNFLRYGVSTEDTFPNKLGAYSVGFKKAMRKLAGTIEVISKFDSPDAETFGLQVGEEWFQDSSFDYPLYVLEDGTIGQGETEVRFKDLKFDWDTHKERFIDELIDVYELYLRNDSLTSKYCNIDIEIVDKTADGGQERVDLSPEDEDFDYYPINWSYVPKAFYPRRYEGIRVSDKCDKRFDEPIHADITVGFMRESSDDAYGTHLYIQGRNILRHESGPKGGYGTGHGKHLSKLGGKARHLQVIVELRATGDASELPWNSVKDDIQENSALMTEVFSWVERVAKDYIKNGRKTFKIPIFSPYDEDNPHSYESSGRARMAIHDYSDRDVVRHKPEDEEIDALKSTVRRAEIHDELGVYCSDSVLSELRPAYEAYLESLVDDVAELEEIPQRDDIDAPLEHTPEGCLREVEGLVDEARKANEGEHEEDWTIHAISSLPSWGVVPYKARLLKETGLSYDRLDHAESLDVPEDSDGGSSTEVASTFDDFDAEDSNRNDTNTIQISEDVLDEFIDEFGGGHLEDGDAIERFLRSAICHRECSSCRITLPPEELSAEALPVWEFMEEAGDFVSKQTSKGIGLNPCGGRTQTDCFRDVVDGLFEEGYLTHDDLPIPSGPKRYIVNTDPVDSAGEEMEDGIKVRDNVWIETKANSREKYLYLIKVAEHAAKSRGV